MTPDLAAAQRPLPTIDEHAHFLDTTGLAYRWIEQRSPELTALQPNYYDIAHDFGHSEYRDAVAGTGIAGVVACEFGAQDPWAEARWIQHCHDTTGTPDAFIAATDLSSPQLSDLLARYRDHLRAISEHPMSRLTPGPGVAFRGPIRTPSAPGWRPPNGTHLGTARRVYLAGSTAG